MKTISKKADRAVRLFLFLLVPLSSHAQEIPKAWIEEAKKYSSREYPRPDSLVPEYERELVAFIRLRILETAAQQPPHSDYLAEIPETGVEYEMVAIKGGRFLMGSPPDEQDRDLDEGPQREIELSPFWIGKFEVTWDQFLPYAQRSNSEIHTSAGTPANPETVEEIVHWISAPTQMFTDMSFGMGLHDGYPAVNMTHHGASKFCQWLSLQTGHFYRLPTEAEWEYACRAGTTSPFSCPAEEIEDHAVIDPEQVRTGYEKVGTKKPNPWGLHDMHGSVMEWCLDAYLPSYAHLAARDPYHPPTQRYGRVIRGGSWYDTAEFCRSANRYCSHPNLMAQDPQLPKSRWWLTDGHWLGFRLCRPVEIPSEEDMYRIWNSGAVHDKPGDKEFELE